MYRLIKAAPLLAAGLAAPAFAAEHEVVVFDGGYFPETTYAEPGDTIRFINAAGLSAAVAATDGSWVSSAPDLSGATTVVVVEGMTKEYALTAIGAVDSAVADLTGSDTTDSADPAQSDTLLPVGYIEWDPAAATAAAETTDTGLTDGL